MDTPVCKILMITTDRYVYRLSDHEYCPLPEGVGLVVRKSTEETIAISPPPLCSSLSSASPLKIISSNCFLSMRLRNTGRKRFLLEEFYALLQRLS